MALQQEPLDTAVYLLSLVFPASIVHLPDEHQVGEDFPERLKLLKTLRYLKIRFNSFVSSPKLEE